MKIENRLKLIERIEKKGYVITEIYKSTIFSHYRATKGKITINSKSLTGLYELTLKRVG